MSDDPQAVSQEATPDPASLPAPEAPGTETTPTENWQGRYEDLRPQYDRAQSQLDQYEQLVGALQSEDAETRARAAAALGLEFVPEETPQDEFEDPYAKRLDQIESLLAAQQQQAVEAQQMQRVHDLESTARNAMEQLAVPEHLRDWVLDRAVAADYATPEGHVDVARAFQEFKDVVLPAEQKAWAETKRAPHVNPSGASGTEAPNLDDRATAIAWATERLKSLSE